MLEELSGPIPGQSLTGEPKGAAWERTPEVTDPESALKYHLDKLRTPEALEATLDILELDVDVVTLTNGLLRGAVAEGVHSIDVSLLIAPIIHESIRGVAEAAGVDYKEGLPEAEDRTAIDYQINQNKARKMLDSMSQEETMDVPLEMEGEGELIEGEAMEMPEGMPRGLMVPRGGMM